MKTTQPTHKKLPSGRVEEHRNPDATMKAEAYRYNAVIPCHTPAQAKQIVRAAEFLRLPEEEKVERLAREILTPVIWDAHKKGGYLDSEMCMSARNKARAVLAAMGMGGAK